MAQFNVQEVLAKLESLGVRPNKKLGQNFLVNQDVCKKIVDKALSFKPNMIVEVGPGLGALTDQIPAEIPQVLIELDRGFVEYWQGLGKNIVHADALQVEWKTLNLPMQSLLLSNLPYQIAASIVIERCIDPQNIDFMILMFQKEVAQRITAKPRTEHYGMLTVVAQAFWITEQFIELSSKDFYPPPQVASRVVIFKRKESTGIDPQKFLSFMKLAFAKRRKFVVTNLGAYKPKEEVIKAVESLGISDKVRAEELTVDQFISIFQTLG